MPGGRGRGASRLVSLMPNKYGFNDLGARRACTVPGCEADGPAYQWTEFRMMAHHDAHEDQRRKEINDAAAERLRNWRGGQT